MYIHEHVLTYTHTQKKHNAYKIHAGPNACLLMDVGICAVSQYFVVLLTSKRSE